MATPIPENYLTELVLALHHEIQSAVDYIAESSAQEGTELGKSPAVMGIESLRIRLPIAVDLEQKTTKIPPLKTTGSIADLRSSLTARKGFMVDKGLPGKLGLFTKVKVRSADETQDPAQKGIGEIEIQFSPLRRP